MKTTRKNDAEDDVWTTRVLINFNAY